MSRVSETYWCGDEDTRSEGIDDAADAIRNGRLVVLPTDTVYGVAADAFDPAAVRRLLRAKGRGRDMPPPVLIAAPTTLDALATKVTPLARQLVEEFWPGALTLICRQQPSLTWDLGDARGTVAVRMPADEVALELIRETGPLAVSSANRSGMPAAVEVVEAVEMLGESVAVYLDSGPAPGGEASTILDITGPTPRVLRQGGISVASLQKFDAAVELAVAAPEEPPGA
jgi:tRNA threonylcarbamoyl adenosine modification protein (Sua5/YciO/YrdC/YwlC family)